MADEAPNKQPPEGSKMPPLSITVAKTRPATGNGGSSRSISGTSPAPQSSAGLQPIVSPLPVQQHTGRVINAYSYLPPQTVHVQGTARNTEQQRIPSSVPPFPPIRGWGPTSHHPVPCYGPMRYPFRNVAAASPMDQLYRHPNLQPVPGLQRVHMQPPGQRPIQPATVQDGRSICCYNHTVFTPIPVRQTSPIVQASRAVPVPLAPNNKVAMPFKKVEPPKSATIGTNEAQRQDKRPAVVYHIPETPSDQEECQSNAPQLTEPLAVPQRPLETTSSSLDGRSKNLNVLGTQLGTQEAHQPSLLQPEAQETAKGDSGLVNFMDEFQLPQELLNAEHFPNTDKLMASTEPLLPVCLFPPIDPKEATQNAALQETPLEGDKGNKEVKNIRSETKERRLPERQIKRDACVHHVKPSLLKASRKSISECVVPIIELCGSDDEKPRVHKSNGSKKHLEEPKLKHSAVPFIIKGSFSQRQKTVMPPTAFVQRGHHLEGEGNSSSGQRACEPTFGNATIAGPIHVVEDSHPSTKAPIVSKDTSKLNYLKKIKKISSETLGSGKIHPSPKAIGDLQLPNGKRKNILPEGEPLRKMSGKSPAVHIPRPKESASGSKKVQGIPQCGIRVETSGDKSRKPLPHQREDTWKGLSTKHVECPADTTGLTRVQSEACPEKQVGKRSREEETKISNPKPQVKEKIKIIIPQAEPLDKKRKRNSGGEPSHPRDLHTGLNNSETARCASKEQYKEKAKTNANPAGTKGKKKGTKIEADTVQQIPRSNLALHMMESVQVFYPLGKDNLPVLPGKKVPSVSSACIVPEKTPSTLPRPLPQPIPKPLPNPLPRQHATSFLKPLPTLKTKLSADSLSKAHPSTLPKLVISSESKPSLRHGPKPPVPGTSGLPGTQVSQAGKWKPTVVGTTYVYPRPPDLQMAGFWRRRDVQHQVPPNTPATSPQPKLPKDFVVHRRRSPVQEFNGATFIPWRTPPRDLEVSAPITEGQRPIREMMKLRAQREREEAACWTSVGRTNFFLEREKK